MIPEKERRERYVLFIAKTKEAHYASLVECVAKRRLCHAVSCKAFIEMFSFAFSKASFTTH